MRTGSSLAEIVAVLATGSALGSITTAALLVQVRTARAIADTAASVEAVTHATAVLSIETRDVTPADIADITDDSLDLRAFRATAIACDTAAAGTTVRWAGSRAPDLAKDSVLILRGGTETAAAITAAAPIESATCTMRADERAYRVRTEPPLRTGDLILAFEHGAYHLSNRALRWRAGAAGRQPLTAELFDDARSAFRAGPFATLTLRTRDAHATDITLPLRPLALEPPR